MTTKVPEAKTAAVADRRNFIKLAGATAAGQAPPSRRPASPQPKPTEARPADAMYRETDHVKRYYELAR